MRPRELYIRATVEHGDTEMIAGLELREDDDFASLKGQLQQLVLLALINVDSSNRHRPDHIATSIANFIESAHPDRYWFLEVCVGDRDGWVQVFAPPARPALPRGAREAVTVSAEEFEAALIGDAAMWSPTPYGKGHDE